MFEVQIGEKSTDCQETPDTGSDVCRMATLTIGIPTFRRPLCLQARLRELVPQLNPSIVLVVQDNASPDDYDAVIAEARLVTNHGRLLFRRNLANVGANGNILKLIETCDTEWLWLLGDDDITARDAVEKVLAAIRSEPDAHYIEFSSWDAYPEKHVAFGVRGLVNSGATFRNLSFISSGVYRVKPLKEHLGVGYEFASTWHSYLAMMIASLGADGMVVLRPERLTLGSDNPVPHWSVLGLCLRLPLLGDLLGDGEDGRSFRAFLSRELNPRWLFFHLWNAHESGVCESRRAAWFVRAVTRNIDVLASPFVLLEFLAEAIALRWPRVAGAPLLRMGRALSALRRHALKRS
jgi:glycosyltransferase involved in cell wall biosynthesis